MKALCITEPGRAELIEIGVPIANIVATLLDGCENLAMVGLVVSLLVRHLERADRLLDPASVAATLFPVHSLSEQDVVDLVHGKRIAVPGLAGAAGPVAGLAPDGRLVGLLDVSGPLAKPLVNFPSDEVLS